MVDYADSFNVPTKDQSSQRAKISDLEPCVSIDYRFPTMKLFPLFLDTPVKYQDLLVCPSVYMKEISYTSEERFKELTRGARQIQCLPDYPSPVHFRISPSVLLFQNAELHSTTTLTLLVTNSSRASRRLRMTCGSHPNISVKYKESAVRKLAAGITVKFTVEYKPTILTDYFHKIVFTDDDNKPFTVPIIALCPRQILDLPDSIQLPITLVKVESKKTLIIRNIGTCPAVANFVCERPFLVEPEKIYLRPDDIATVTVLFCTSYLGNWKSTITVVFETGEKIAVNVEGSSELGNVYLSSARVDILDTYMNMNRQGTVSIHNSSDSIVRFQWHLFKSIEEDHDALSKLKSFYEQYQEIENKKVAKLVHFDVYNENIHNIICDRITRDNISLATPDSLHFFSNNFRIFPIKGEIWPGGICNCSVVFSSEVIGKFETFTFLEIDGLESRLPLCLSASSVGPNIRLNIDSIDVGSIHLLQVFSFQIIVENIGDIGGSICFIGKDSKWCQNSTISCSPFFYKLEPGHTKPYLISISRSKIGIFCETVTFQIYESGIDITCIIRGNVREPPIKFSEHEINFGSVPLGFELVKTVKMINPCNHPYMFNLETFGYWEDDAVKAWDGLPVPSRPKQFSVFPSDGLIKPYQQLEIKVIGLLNVENSGNNYVKLTVWNNSMDHLTLVIKYTVSPIFFSCLNPDILINFAFLNYNYEQDVCLRNNSDSTCFYTIYAENSNQAIEHTVEEGRGVILPYAQTTFHFKLKVTTVGKQKTKIMLKTFGNSYVMHLCTVTMNGIHPVLNLQPMELEWGEVVLLVPTKKTFSIINVSPIKTEFSILMDKQGDTWSFSEEVGVIEGNSKVDIEVILRLNDLGLTETVLTVASPGGNLRLKITAKGIGCAIITVPGLCPSFNMGHLVSSVYHEMDVLVINKSSLTCELLWATCEDLSNWTKTVTDRNQGEHIKIVPYRVTLKPGQEEKIKITAYCEEEKFVEELYYCLGVPGAKIGASHLPSQSRKTVGECLIYATFLNPKLQISKNEINFCVRVAPDDQFPASPTETVKVTPDFTQEIFLDLHVKPPFKMVQKNGLLVDSMSMVVRDASPLDITILFDTSFRTDCYSWSADSCLIFSYKNHTSKAILALHGEVQYPNILLNTHLIDFGGIPKHSEAYREVIMRNMSPYDIQYSWEWSKHTVRPLVSTSTQDKSEEIIIKEDSKQGSDWSGLSKSLTSSYKTKSSFPIINQQPSEERSHMDLMKREILNVLINDGPYPEDCELDEEDRIALQDVAFILKKFEELYDKFSNLLDVSSESLPVVSTTHMDTLYPNSTSRRLLLSAIDVIKRLLNLVIQEETLAGFQNAVIPFISCFIHKDIFKPVSPIMPLVSHDELPSVSKLIDLIPKWGVLLSGQEQVVGALFKPFHDVEVEALATCKIYGGPTEKVVFKGICSEVKFSFSKEINFGLVPFCEVNTRDWMITNECCINIVFRVIKISDHALSVEPMVGYLEANSNCCFRIKYLPGYLGSFNKAFHIELATLEVAKVAVIGMSVMSQVVLDLPQSEPLLPTEIMYRAIANLTHPTFAEFSCKHLSLASSIQSNAQESSSLSMSVRSKIAELNGFEMIGTTCCSDDIPNLTSIKLAYERQIMSDCVTGDVKRIRAHSLSKNLNHKYFNDCIPPVYVIDFGSVIFNTTVEKTIQVYNYGFLDAQVSLSLPENKDTLTNRGISFTWDGLCHIGVGGVGTFTVTLHPSSLYYLGNFFILKINLLLQICCGPSLPIKVKAYFVQPEVSLKNMLEFGEIKCSHIKSLGLTLTNISTVNAEWELSVRAVKRKPLEYSVAVFSDNEPSPFSYDKNSGMIPPGHSDTIFVSFQPPTHGVYERVLEVKLSQSRSIARCKLRGSALEPYFNVNQLKLDFGTVIPYCSIHEHDVVINNPCPFSTEIILLDYNREVDLENRVLRAMCLYYKTDRMQLPLKYFDVQMSPQLIEMYDSMARLGAFLRLTRMHALTDSVLVVEEDTVVKKTKVKSSTPAKGGGAKANSAKGSKRRSRTSQKGRSSNLIDEKTELDQFLAQKTPSEIEQLVTEYIDWLGNIPENDLLDTELMEKMNLKIDILENLTETEEDTPKMNSQPRLESLNNFKEQENKDQLKKGTLIIFYGAPFTGYSYLAHKVASQLSLKPLSLDKLITEEAAYSHSPGAVFLRETVNTAFNSILAIKRVRELSKQEEEVPSQLQTTLDLDFKSVLSGVSSLGVVSNATTQSKFETKEIIDPLDDLESKVNFILEYYADEAHKRAEEAALRAQEALIPKKPQKSSKDKEKPTKSGKSSTSKSTKDSSRISKKDGLEDMEFRSDTFLDISMEIFYDLISHRLKLEIFDAGVVVDNLTGTFIKNAVKSLDMLLNIAGPTEHIYFINVFNSYEGLNILREHQMKSQELKNLKRTEGLMNKLKLGYEDQIQQEDRKSCFEALDYYHNTAVKLRNDIIKEQMLADELSGNISEGSEHILNAKHPKNKLATANKTSSTNIATPASHAGHSTAKVPKSTEEKSSTISNKKGKPLPGKKNKKENVEELPIEPEIPPEEIEVMVKFKRYSDDFARIYCMLDKHDRLKVEPDFVERGSGIKRVSMRILKRGSRSRNMSTSFTSKIHSPSKEKEITGRDQEHPILICPRVGEEISADVGVPIIVLNNANIKTELNYLGQLSGIKSLLPSVDKRQTLLLEKVYENSVVENDLFSNKNFWYDKPNVIIREELSEAFCLENKFLPKELSVKESVTIMRAKPQTCMSSAKLGKSLKARPPPMRKISPLIQSSRYPENKVPFHLSKKKLQNISEDDKESLRTRTVLPTGGIIAWTVSFYPTEVGLYQQDLRIGITGWPNALTTISVEGFVQLPDILRQHEAVFPEVVDDVEDVPPRPCFIRFHNTFDFGYVFSYNENHENISNSVTAQFKFTNSTKVPVIMNFVFNLNVHFDVEPSQLILKPGDTKMLNVNCTPQVEGVQQDVLFCAIVNNPELFIVQLSCTGVKGQMVVKPKELLFDKVLIKFNTTKTLVLSNICGLHLFWAVKPFDDVSRSLTCSLTSGCVEPFGKALIHFSYKALGEEVLDKPVTLLVLDKEMEKGGVVLQTISIPVKGESYDVIVSICFIDSDKELNFGEIKVGNEYFHSFLLDNRGVYDIDFRIEFEEFPHDSEYSPSDMFSLNISEGVLPSRSKVPVKIHVTVKCMEELVLDEIPLIKIILFEKTNYVANLSIPVSLSSHFTKFRLVPKDEVGFGSVLVGETRVLYLTIENIGYFEFNYQVISKAELGEIIDNVASLASQNFGGTQKPSLAFSMTSALRGSSDQDDRVTVSSRIPDLTKIKKIPDKKTIGPFTVHGVTGLVKKGASVKIKITCSPDRATNYNDVILIQASELPEAIRFGLPVSLVASGCLPSVDFSNVSLMYREAMLSSDSAKLQDESGLPVVIYSCDSGLLFQNVVVSTTKSIKIYLKNTAMVSATVRAKVVGSSSVRSEYFTLSHAVLPISAYMTETLSVNFSPESIELSEGTLEMELEIPYSKPVIEKVALSGRGCLPLVDMISPIQVKSCVKSDRSVIDMGTCLLDFHLSTILTFRNSGICYCEFILELTSEMEDNYFSLAALPHCKDLIKNLDDGRNERLSCHLTPKGELQLSCVFAPLTAVVCISSIKVFIVDNPYEQYKILLCGRGHIDNVTIEGLPFLLDPIAYSALNLKLNKGNKNLGSSISSYSLDFDEAYVGHPIKQDMKLRNHSDSWIKFTWDLVQPNPQGLSLYPRVGCIPPKSSVLGFAVFVPTTVIRFTKFVLRCNLDKVILMDPCVKQWNCHEKLVAWLKHEDKFLKRYDVYCNIAENEDEPVYSEVTKLGELKLQVQLEADKPTVVADVLHIGFPDTLICQTNSSSIILKNTSRVEARFNCIMTVTRAYPSFINAEEAFSSGLLTGNFLYPNVGCSEDDSVSSPTCSSSKGCRIKSALSKKSESVLSNRLSTRSSSVNELPLKREEYRSCPFIVSPEFCVLPRGKSCTVNIKFMPMQMFVYNAQLLFRLEGVDESSCPSVDVVGTGLTSFCHLEIDNVDLVPQENYPIGTKPIIMDCLGLPASFNKRFGVINPTDKNYHFEWIKMDRNCTKVGIYEHHCTTPTGLIHPHKSYDMEFSFFSLEEGKFESLWLLRIPEMDMEQNIVFLTSVREPSVSFNFSTLTLNPTIVGACVMGEIVLQNNEDVEIKFKVDKCSLFSEGRYEKLEVEPLTGLLCPRALQNVSISFTPKRAGDGDFVIRVQIAKKKEPLTLRVATCCFSVEAIITLCPEGTLNRVQLTTEKKNHFNLGHMELKVPKRVEFNICNTGKAGFYVETLRKDEQLWKKSSIQLECDAKSGFISPGTKTSLNLIFSVTSKTSFNNLPLLIKVLKGPNYEVMFSGDAAGPEYVFNFLSYEFGHRLVQTSDKRYNSVDLIFRNEDEVSIEIEKLFKDTDIFSVEMEYSVVPARSALTIKVMFFPRESISYSADIEFLINGMYSKLVNFTGTGVPLKVELVKTKDKLIDFGSVQIGQTVCKSVELINHSLTSVCLHLLTQSASRENYVMNVKPKELTLPVEKVSKFTVYYTPQKRGINMAEKVWFECEDYSEVLIGAEGRGVGAEFKLDRDMIPFGLTVLGASKTIKLALINSGDFGARVQWDFSRASDCFKISPKDGYSTPSSILTFDLKFTPKSNTPKSVRNQVICTIENFKTPLTLVLTGNCSDVPPPKDYIKFFTPLRQRVTKSIPILNNTSEKWLIYPTISGDCFTGESVITIMPKTTANYDVTYFPMSTSKKKSHEGSVFFAYPDGHSILYGLKGVANPPDCNQPISWTTPAKKNFIGKVPIKNWFADQSQRFTVQIKALGDTTKSINKNLYKIYGNAQIEVGPSSTREYEVHFFSYIPSTLNFTLTYANETDGDYAWLELTVVVTEPQILETFSLETRVRELVELQIPFSNPMDTKQVLMCETGDHQLITNAPLTLPPKQNGIFEISYFPVAVEQEREKNIVVKSTGIGAFYYQLFLTAKPPLLPPVVYLSASLGRNQSHSLVITNYTPADTIFKIQVDCKSLVYPKDVSVRAMNSESIIILYEPFSETTENITLIAESEQAGIFRFPLSLIGSAPVPKGPFEIQPGGSITLYFKNIFLENRDFIMSSDCDLFTIKNPKRQIKSKQEGEFLVNMVMKEDMLKGNKIKWKDSIIASKIIVIPADASLSQHCWVYYIRANIS